MENRQQSGPRPRWSWTNVFIKSIATLALIHPLATALAKLGWPIDALTHFYGIGLVLSVLACLLLGFSARYRLMIAYLIFTAVQAELMLRYSWPALAIAQSGAARLKILMMNIHKNNTNYEAIASLIRAEDPDVVGFVEVSPHLIPGLMKTGIDRRFANRSVLPLGASGLAIWFRDQPVEPATAQILVSGGNPFYTAKVLVADRPVTIWLVHPPNPIGQGRGRADREIKALGVAIGEIHGSRVMIGDFNRTEGSPYFTDLIRDSGLRDSRLGIGRQASWPLGSPYQIAIDHALISEDLAVVNRRLGPSIDSDHAPLIVEISVADPVK